MNDKPTEKDIVSILWRIQEAKDRNALEWAVLELVVCAHKVGWSAGISVDYDETVLAAVELPTGIVCWNIYNANFYIGDSSTAETHERVADCLLSVEE